MLQDRRKAWGFSLFGDDLRYEVGGKASLMGIYQNDMIFSGVTLPTMVPKLAILIMYYEVYDAIRSDIIFKVSFPEETNVLGEAQIVRKTIPPTPPLTKEEKENEERILHIRVPLILTPFMIERPGRLRVRAHYVDEPETVLRLGSLEIKSMSPEELMKAHKEAVAQLVPKSENN